MFRSLVIGGAVLVAVLTLGLSVGASAAAPDAASVAEDAFPSPRLLVLRGSHGYRVYVESFPSARRRADHVVVTTKGRGSYIQYKAPAKFPGEGIHASLGRFGAIHLRWVPDGRVAELRLACHGHGPRRQYFFDRGAYVGTLRFRGGDGFTAVRAHRVEWRRSWYRGNDTCRREGGELNPGPGAILGAESGGQDPRSLFRAYQAKRGASVLYAASDRERVGRLEIERVAVTRGGPATLALPRDLSAATVSPPSPFTGTATFTATEQLGEDEGADGTWLGDLAVHFPDGSHVPLAGDAFEAHLRSGELDGAARP